MPKLVIEHVSISDLKEWGDNPRYHNVEAIRRSMERFGVRWPIIVNRRTMQVEAGHGRLKALQELGEMEVPVLFVDDDDLTAKAFAIADNRTQELTQWDEQGLAHVLTELEAGGELEPTAFSIDDLNELLRKLGRFEGETFDVEAAMQAAPEQRANTQPGEIWQLGRHRLMCGDSTKAGDINRLMNGEKARLMATDPPYGDSWVQKARDMHRLGYGHSQAERREVIEADDFDTKKFHDFLVAWIGSATEIALAKGAVIYVWHGAKRIEFELALRDAGFHIHQAIIWKKPSFVIGRLNYHPQCEWALHGWLKGNGRPPFLGERNQADVWELQREGGWNHPTQKPVALFGKPMINHLNIKGLAYDPFVGSGTAIIAAEQTGRICYGMEIIPYYCDVAIARWEAFTGSQAVLVEEREMAYA